MDSTEEHAVQIAWIPVAVEHDKHHSLPGIHAEASMLVDKLVEVNEAADLTARSLHWPAGRLVCYQCHMPRPAMLQDVFHCLVYRNV